MKKPFLKVTTYVVVLFVLLACFLFITTPKAPTVTPVDGIVDFSKAASADVYEISTQGWAYYPKAFFSAADFAAGKATPSISTGNHELAEYGTYRLLLKLTPGETYAITGHSFNFSQQLYIDGQLIGSIGTPGTSRQTTVPDSKTYTYRFVAQHEVTEFIFHAASFYHREGANSASFRIGAPEAITRWALLESIRSNIISGSLLTVFLYYLGMYIIFNRKPHFLFISLAALMTVIRLSLTGEKYFLAIFPTLSWSTAIRLEYLCNSLFVVFLFLYFVTLYPGMISKTFVLITSGVACSYAALILIFDTLVFTRLLPIYSVLWVVNSTVTLWRLALQLKKKELHTALIFTGLAVFAACAVFDELMFMINHTRTYHTIIIGTLICIFMNMIALTLNLYSVELALTQAKKEQRELDETNQLLDKLNRTKNEFMANISHEMRTPLTVMSVHAQLSKTLLEKDTDLEEIYPYLQTISQEAERLSRLTNNMLDLNTGKTLHEAMMPIDISPLLHKTGEVYRSMIEKKNNQLFIDVPDALPLVYGNMDMLIQVALNLLSNANRHTQNGQITISAASKANYIAIYVCDTGEGIAPELLPYVFERHVVGTNKESIGLGLPICQEIILRHQGSISILKSDSNGTTIYITLPIINPEETNQ